MYDQFILHLINNYEIFEVSGMINIFGNEFNFGYKKCEDWF